MKIFWRVINYLLLAVLCSLTLTRSVPVESDARDRVRAYTRMIEFNYINWTLDAIGVKWAQASLDAARTMQPAQQRTLVDDYLKTLQEYNQVSADIALIYADPQITDPDQAAQELLASQLDFKSQLEDLGPLAESVLQMQISAILAEQGLTFAGQPMPPLLYHVTLLPYNLVISPRAIIQQEASISLLPGLTLEEITRLEKEVEQGLGVSALVTPIGGVGTYPTMVGSSTNLEWLIDTAAHEWIHNYLTLRPLGLLYEKTPELRAMNETTASLAGEELNRLVLERFYPDLLPPPAPAESTSSENSQNTTIPPAPVFDYRAEMHQTRVTTDELLAMGRIKEAENYMEARRLFFREHGYMIRRLNQAYFAFYGAYAAGTVGAQGEDPVGPAVRALRQQSPSLAAFIKRIAWVTSFEQLQQLTR